MQVLDERSVDLCGKGRCIFLNRKQIRFDGSQTGSPGQNQRILQGKKPDLYVMFSKIGREY